MLLRTRQAEVALRQLQDKAGIAEALLPPALLKWCARAAQAAHYVLRSGEQRGPSSGAFASLASSLYGPSTRLEPQVAAA